MNGWRGRVVYFLTASGSTLGVGIGRASRNRSGVQNSLRLRSLDCGRVESIWLEGGGLEGCCWGEPKDGCFGVGACCAKAVTGERAAPKTASAKVSTEIVRIHVLPPQEV
jgi:hypothetical protein